MQTRDQAFLGTEPVGRLLMRLAIPTVIAQLVNMLYNIVDRIYIGHIAGIGSLALTGVGVCMPIIMIVTAFAALVASGSAPRAPSRWGAAPAPRPKSCWAAASRCKSRFR